MSDENDEIMKEFLVECHENLDQLDQLFLDLEENPNDRSKVACIFRGVHTIKGSAGFLGMPKLERLTHAGEGLLSQLRDGQLTLSEKIVSNLLQMIDAVRSILAAFERSGQEGDADYAALIAELSSLLSPVAVRQSASECAEQQDLDAVPLPVGKILIAKGKVSKDEVEAAYQQQQAGDPRPLGEILVAQQRIEPAALLDALRTQHESGGGNIARAESSIRVDVGLLDDLMNLVGELVLARNQVLQFAAAQSDAAFLNTTQRLNLITTELQEGVMKTRMQPIGNIWNKFPRIVRDLALACNKKVRVEMLGEGTDLDRTIIEAIKDPLTHIIRNSVDHGIESPEARIALGKPEVGRLLMRAYHEGGQVIIEISDDGAGVDTAMVREKAIARGMISAEAAGRMSERELTNLIFMPGFSTAKAVTNVSGRGVGMDVVKTNVERIGGMLDVNNRPGQGLTLRIKIPLTLAIIPALLVTTGGERFAIPQVSLLELVRLESAQAKAAIEMAHGAPVYRLRGNLLPLVFLHEALGLLPSPEFQQGERPVSIVVLKADERQFGVVVEDIHDTEEIVVKPLGKELKMVNAFAGATIMGDGQVALILDVLGVAQRGGVISETREKAAPRDEPGVKVQRGERQTLLLFRVGERTTMAIPLACVDRLEEFARARLERAGGVDVVQYRQTILPLVNVAELFGQGGRLAPADFLQTIVFKHREQRVGIVVDEILDILEDDVEITRVSLQEGILGSAVVQGRVIDLLDFERALAGLSSNICLAAEAA